MCVDCTVLYKNFIKTCSATRKLLLADDKRAFVQVYLQMSQKLPYFSSTTFL